jgi:hypothetical protein
MCWKARERRRGDSPKFSKPVIENGTPSPNQLILIATIEPAGLVKSLNKNLCQSYFAMIVCFWKLLLFDDRILTGSYDSLNSTLNFFAVEGLLC